MRAFALASAASLALAACTAPPREAAAEGSAPPRRVVSLNLCTDELLLLLAEPDQIASVTHLAAREAETPLWQEAAKHPLNDGTLASAVEHRPDLVLTQGGAGDRLGIADRMHVRLVNLPFPQSLDDVAQAIRSVAGALGRKQRGEALIAQIEDLRRTAPPGTIDTLWIGGGGRTVSDVSVEAQWMRLAGYRQRAVTGDQVTLETLLSEPPQVLLRSDYRAGQYSRAQAWLSHPLASASRAGASIATDGRRWTCLGPLMVDEIKRLRRERPE